MARVSVIMPVYNSATYVAQAIDSLMAQTYADWELLITDDGSTDDTPALLAQITDPRVQIFRQPNGGEAAARNTALQHAGGEFITFLDADDLYLPTFLAEMVRYMESNPAYGVVFADGYMIDAKGKRIGRLTEFRPAVYTGYILEPLVIDNAILGVPVCTMVRQSAIQRASARFDPTIGYGTDWDFWIQLARVVQFGYFDQPVCCYRVHQTNMTRVQSNQQRKNDLAKGRTKVLTAPWFDSMSTATRQKIAYQLIVSLLENQPERQLAALKLPHVVKLHSRYQALLYRLVGVQILQKQNNLPLAQKCLQYALILAPADLKAALLLQLLHLGRTPVLIFLGFWRPLYEVGKRIKNLRKRKSRPIPRQLRPMNE
jgi:hypothetical protein